jgi:hypothetical protein
MQTVGSLSNKQLVIVEEKDGHNLIYFIFCESNWAWLISKVMWSVASELVVHSILLLDEEPYPGNLKLHSRMRLP